MPRLFALPALALSVLACAALALAQTPAPGCALPDFQANGTLPGAQCAYMGVTNAPFPIREVQGKALLIEIFSMYCPHCQREAPKVNELYEAIQASGHGDELKVLGVGAGNSQFEVDFFRDQYQIPFPLFPDPGFAIHCVVGEVSTPFFILVTLPDLQVRHVTKGAFDTPRAFLDELLRAAGLTEGAGQ